VKIINLASRSVFVHTSNGSLTRRNILQHGWGRRLYFLSEGSRAADFISRKNPSPSAGFKPPETGVIPVEWMHCKEVGTSYKPCSQSNILGTLGRRWVHLTCVDLSHSNFLSLLRRIRDDSEI
jgi:hypothetical protein